MKYADNTVCPDCREPLPATPIKCEACGLRLDTVEASLVWASLVKIDQLLGAARNAKVAPAPLPSMIPPALQIPIAPKPQRKPIDTGAILLGLGALFLLVAGSIASALFLGLFALPLMTLVAAGIAVITDARKLKTSTETMLTITGIMAGLSLGIFLWPYAKGNLVWGLLAFATWYGFIAATRGQRDYAAPKFFMAFSLLPITFSSLAIFTPDKYPAMALVFVTFILAGATSFGLWQKIRYYTFLAGFGTLLAGTIAVLASVGQILLKPDPEIMYNEGAVYPAFLITFVSILGVTQVTHHGVKKILGGLAYSMSTIIIVATSLAYDPGRPTSITIALIALVTVSAVIYKQNILTQTMSLINLVWVGITGLIFYYEASTQLEKVANKLFEERYRTWTKTFWAPMSKEALYVLFLGIALLIVVWLYGKLVKLEAHKKYFSALAQPFAILLAFLTLSYLYPTTFSLAALLLVLGIGYYYTSRSLLFAGAIILLAPALTLNYYGTFLLIGTPATLFMGYALLRCNELPVIKTFYAIFTSALIFSVNLYIGLYYHWVAELHTLYCAVIIALLFAVSAPLRVSGQDFSHSIEIGATVPLLLVLALTPFETELAWSSLVTLVLGLGVFIDGLYSKTKIYQYAGSILFGIAWVERLLASNIETPEAYTAPFALALLLLGSYKMAKDSTVSSWAALAPGVTMTLAPSVPWFLAEPVSFRALALGVVSILVLFVGLGQKLQAPLVLAALCLGGMAFIELGPYLLLLSRWILIGGFGIIFVALGITFEQRVKDGKAIAAYLGSMR